MRRLLVPVVVGVAAALAGCHGVQMDLGASPAASHSAHASSKSSHASSKSAKSGSTSATVQAAGPVSAGSGTLRVLSEPQAGFSAVYALIKGARSSVELTMYTLRDTTAEGDLAAAAKRGVARGAADAARTFATRPCSRGLDSFAPCHMRRRSPGPTERFR